MSAVGCSSFQQILAQVGAVVEQKAPRLPRFVQPLHNAELIDGHACVGPMNSHTKTRHLT